MTKRKIFAAIFAGQKISVFFSCAFAAMMALDGIVSPYFLGRITNLATQRQFTRLPLTLFFWFLSFIAIGLGALGFSYFNGQVRKKVNEKLRNGIMAHAYASENLSTASDKFVASSLNDVKQFESNFVNPAMTFLYCILQGSITLVFLLLINAPIGLVFVLLGFIPTMVPKFTAKWLKAGSANWSNKNQKYTEVMEDTLRARPLVRHYDASRSMLSRVKNVIGQAEQAYFVMNFRQQESTFIVNVLYYLTVILSLAIGLWQVSRGRLAIGSLITIYMAADRVVSPLISGVSLFNQMTSSEIFFSKIYQPDVSRRPVPKALFQSLPQQLLAFQNVDLGYDGKTIINQATFAITQGSKNLIIGASGSGKSTLFSAILNELAPLSGRVVYADSLKKTPFVKNFVVIEQEPFIFQDTVRFNLTLGNTQIEDQRLIQALKRVLLTQFASPQGLTTVLGESQQRLSGGERKKLEIARALLYHPKILLVDEALSGLDTASALAIHHLILAFPATVIEIEHQVDDQFLSDYDQILKISGQKILGQVPGTSKINN